MIEDLGTSSEDVTIETELAVVGPAPRGSSSLWKLQSTAFPSCCSRAEVDPSIPLCRICLRPRNGIATSTRPSP